MRRLPGTLPRDVVVVLATVAVLLGGCSRDDSAQPPAGPSARPTAGSPTPAQDAGPAASATASTAAPTVPAGPASPSPGPGPTAPSGDAALPEAPTLPPGQSAAATGFAQCAQRYQERIDGITLGGAVTPVLLEQWAQAYQDAAALSAEGDAAGAASACNALQAAMDDVLG
jgi:hypothetical protein